MLAEHPGIAVANAKDVHAADITEQEEAEALDVIEDMDLEGEIPHVTFGQRDPALENYDIGVFDMVPLTGQNA